MHSSWKKVLALICGASMCWPVRAYGILRDQQERINTLIATEVRIHVEEDFEPPDPPMPGTWFKKEPSVVNDSPVPCYIRARVAFSSDEALQVCEPLEYSPAWTEGTDGYLYLSTPLAAGEKSPPLFSQVGIRADTDSGQLEKVLPFEILVYAEGVLAGEFSPADAWSLTEGGAGA